MWLVNIVAIQTSINTNIYFVKELSKQCITFEGIRCKVVGYQEKLWMVWILLEYATINWEINIDKIFVFST